MRSFVAALIAFSFATAPTLAPAEEPPAAAPPSWFLDEIAALATDGGRWIADNADYRSSEEPYEAYGIEWKASFDGTTLSGRLFGLRNGREVADFWEFRRYWHPSRREAVVEQFGGGGALGIGTMRREGNEIRMDQSFFAPGGPAARRGHISHRPDPDTRVTESFDIEDGKWQPRRTYVWKRAPARAERR